MKYDPYVLGGSNNEEYSILLEKCPYTYTPGVFTFHLLMSRYIINQSLPLPEDSNELIDKFISLYNLKSDYVYKWFLICIG